jgi:hypothetical protein
MLAVADPPEPRLIPGLKYPPGWHRAQEAKEQAWLDAYMRWVRKFGTLPQPGQGGPQ